MDNRAPAALLPDDDGIHENHISLLNKSSLNQLKLSFDRSSNMASHALLEDVWNLNRAQFDMNMDPICSSAKSLLKKADTNINKQWKSSIDSFEDAKTLFEKSLPNCKACTTTQDYVWLDNFLKNQCICDLGITETYNNSSEPLENNTLRMKGRNARYTDTKSILSKNSESLSQETKSSDEKCFKPKFNRQKPVRNSEAKIQMEHKIPQTDSKDIEMVDLDKEKEDNNTHKSYVAKITFKTAKEQLLASNPAAKRTLGASRKAQGKFVSPMITAQEKQEAEAEAEAAISDERLKHLDPKMVELIESEIIDKGTPIGWDDIAGLQLAKSVIQEAVVWPLLRPDIFTGLRRPPRGVLLFGPPGTGKTLIGKCVAAQCNATFFSISASSLTSKWIGDGEKMVRALFAVARVHQPAVSSARGRAELIGKCVAAQCNATFFSISASSLTSKWIGDGEKMVRALFAVARVHQPAVIFIDEIDSLLTQRSDTEHEATRRIKTEFLVQFDGAATAEEERLLIVGATNRPQELDEAARRRLVKRLYIPLPDIHARKQIITNLLRSANHGLDDADVASIARLTEGYSGADMKSLCSEAAMGPVRAVPLELIATIHPDQVRAVSAQDFIAALQRVRPSVSQDDLGVYVKWNNTYGQGI